MVNSVVLKDMPPSPAHRGMFEQILNEGRLIEQDYSLLSLFRGKKTFLVDVGANIGAFSAAALRLIETVDVIAFEPNPSLLWFQDEVRKRYESLGRSMRVEMCGLAERAGTIDLYIPRVDNWYVIGEASMDPAVFDLAVVKSRLSGYSKNGQYHIEKAEVNILRFDDLGVEPPLGAEYTIVKIDVENFEPYVLRGMNKFLLNYTPIVVMENSRQDAHNMLIELGYNVFCYDSNSREIIKYINSPQANLIYIHPNSAGGSMIIGRPAPEVPPGPVGLQPQPSGCMVENPSARVPLTLLGVRQTYSYNGELVQAYRCVSCGHIGFDSPPQAELDTYYQSTYPENARSWYNFDADTAAYKVTSRANAVETIARILGFSMAAVLHEFGCAFGGTVAELSRRGYSITGSELNKSAVAEARRKGNDFVFDSPAIEVIKNNHGKANFVYSFHCLEHFSDPYPFLSELKDVLAEDGCLVLFLPNGFALDPITMGFTSYSWFSYPGHLNLWSASSLGCAALRTGYDVALLDSNEIRVRPAPAPFSVAGAVGVADKVFAEDLTKRRYLGEEVVVALVPKNALSAKRLSNEIKMYQRILSDQREFEASVWGKLSQV